MFWVDKFEAAIDPSHFDGNIVWNQNNQSMMHVMLHRVFLLNIPHARLLSSGKTVGQDTA